MPQLFAYEIIILLSIKTLAILVQCYLGYQLLKSYFTKGYPSTILTFVFAVLTLLLSEIIAFFDLFIVEEELFMYLDKLSIILLVISIYFLLLFSEVFENETIFSRQQMVVTILATITIMAVFMGTFGTEWNNNLDVIVINTLDTHTEFPLIELLILIFSISTGLLIIINLRNGLKDAWITQKKQLIFMVIGTIFVYFLPPLIKESMRFFFQYDNNSMNFFILRNLTIIGFIFFFISFKKLEFFSLFNRRRADKIVVTNLDGLPLFAYDFKMAVHHIDETLFAGAIVAITMLMTESIKSPAPIAEVVMKNKYKVILESKSNILALILTPKGSSYQRESLKRFIKSFESKFGSLVASGEVVDLELLSEGGKSILLTSFGIPSD